MYSDWIPSEFDSQAAASLTSQLLHTFDSSEFDQNEDVALVYGRREVSAVQDDVFLLPYTHSSQEELYRHRTSTGSGFTAIYVDGTSTDGGNKVYTFFDDYRYVIIPGGNPASGKSASVDYSKLSYEEIIALFNIPE